MNKIGQDLVFWLGNVQIQPSKFEPSESGDDSVDINLSGSDSSSEQVGITISTSKESTNGLVSRSEYIEKWCSKISNKLVTKIHLWVFALFTLQKVMFTNSFQPVGKADKYKLTHN